MNKRGFTLLEVLVAISLSAVVLGALYTSFFTVERAVSGSSERIAGLQDLRTCLEIMRQELEAAVPGTVQREGSEFSIKDRDLYGKATSLLSFRTFGSPVAGPARVTYYIEERKDGKRVLMKSLLRGHSASEKPMEAEVLDDVLEFKVEGQRADDWLATWPGPETPQAVRISITIPQRDGPMRLEQVVSPKVGRNL